MEYDGIIESLLFTGFMVGNFINPNCVIRDADGFCCFHSRRVCVFPVYYFFFFCTKRGFLQSATSAGVIFFSLISTRQCGSIKAKQDQRMRLHCESVGFKYKLHSQYLSLSLQLCHIRSFIAKNGVRRLYLQCLCIVLNGFTKKGSFSHQVMCVFEATIRHLGKQ